ncbi:ABC transporter ATP-binding protein [Acerihabitans sp. KWT182]|uniref:ABC-type dipeptide transporter n=1 Tax=Acerihabitans sp. KWT182 TaxID=3157919 RepID=A0AAU7QEG2_9GAMM
MKSNGNPILSGPRPPARRHGVKEDDSLLSVDALRVDYVARGHAVAAVRGVSFEIQPGEVVALVGESGSGKSTIALAAMGMLPDNACITGGSIVLAGRELTRLGEREFNRIRGREVGWIPQDPMMSLNPLHRIGRQVHEPLTIHHIDDGGGRDSRVTALLNRVHIPDAARRAWQFPHQLSGGMRQRVLIAAAIGPGPRLIVADEPTTALDVTVQKAILDDIAALIATSGMSMLLITHDLGVAADRADRIIVLKDGGIVEQGSSYEVLTQPRHDYTRLLIASAPGLAGGRRRVGGAAKESILPAPALTGEPTASAVAASIGEPTASSTSASTGELPASSMSASTGEPTTFAAPAATGEPPASAAPAATNESLLSLRRVSRTFVSAGKGAGNMWCRRWWTSTLR